MSQPVADTTSAATAADVVESFFGVYLLYSLHPKYKGRTYIGYTVNPNRRINQHNKGSTSGGARRTSNRGPWEMVLIVHGFPNDISALRFEWAWQHPQRSRRLKNVRRKKPRENQFQYQLRILLEMLRMGPWNKLPLTIRWLAEQYYQDFPADQCPPMHMPIAMGPVCTKKVPTSSDSPANQSASCDPSEPTCRLCSGTVTSDDAVSCVMTHCHCVTHIICLARHFIGNNSEQILPIEGFCPTCNTQVLWGDVVRKKKGCYKNLDSPP